MTRDEAMAVLEAREGMPPEQVEHFDDDAPIIAAAQAPAGQPCADCRKLVVWTEDEHGGAWDHVETPTGCFLARSDER